MAIYTTLNELIRDGMEMRLECRKCHFVQRADPEEAKDHVAALHRANAFLSSHRLEPVHKGNPDATLHGCVDGLPCPICAANDWKVDAIKPLKSERKDDK